MLQKSATWPRQITLADEPENVVKIVNVYSQWLSETDIHELFVNAKPGALVTGPIWFLVRSWPNLFGVTVPGVHFVQEDSADPIGESVAECYESL